MIQDSKQFLTNSRKSKILDEIINQFENCEEFIISVAFITFSGVVCILEVLRQLRAKGIKGKILTGCYLNFTEPKALKKLLEFDNIELKSLMMKTFMLRDSFS